MTTEDRGRCVGRWRGARLLLYCGCAFPIPITDAAVPSNAQYVLDHGAERCSERPSFNYNGSIKPHRVSPDRRARGPWRTLAALHNPLPRAAARCRALPCAAARCRPLSAASCAHRHLRSRTPTHVRATCGRPVPDHITKPDYYVGGEPRAERSAPERNTPPVLTEKQIKKMRKARTAAATRPRALRARLPSRRCERHRSRGLTSVTAPRASRSAGWGARLSTRRTATSSLG